MSNEYGIIYQATGARRYLVFCVCSVQSLRWAGWTGPVRVLVDALDFDTRPFEELGVELVKVDVPRDGKISARWIKTRLDEYSIFERTLYLDCDIIALCNSMLLWDEIGAAELAFARDFTSVEACNHGLRGERELTLREGVAGL